MNTSFKHFLFENQFGKIEEREIAFKKIAQNCKQFLKESGGIPVFRGIKIATNSFYSPTPKNRPSKDSDRTLTFVLNSIVYKMFGINTIRDKCFFGTHDLHIAQGYGQTFAIFPTDGYEFVWSDLINDPYADDHKIYLSIRNAMIEEGFNTIHGVLQVNNIILTIAQNIKSDYWVENTKYGLEYPNKILGFPAVSEAFKDHLIDNDIEKTLRAFIRAFNCQGKNLGYHDNDLIEALKSNHEIMFTGCSGYYCVAIDTYDEYSQVLNDIRTFI